MALIQKGKYILFGTLLVYGFLVATHKGEFWPLSIYPMFSQAGNPWTRSLVRDVTEEKQSPTWTVKTKSELPGQPFAMNDVGINTNDLANFISKNDNWSNEKVQNIREYFREVLEQRNLIVYKVRGQLSETKSDSVAVQYTPYIFLRSDTTIFNPHLFESRRLKKNL